jgi:hypothetical protein
MSPLDMPVQARGGSWIIALFFLSLGGGWGWWSTPRPGEFNPEKGPRYLWYKIQDGPQSRSGRAWRTEKILPAQGFEPRTQQGVATPTIPSRPPLPIWAYVVLPVQVYIMLGILRPSATCEYQLSGSD